MEELLVGLRSFMYRMLLPFHEYVVIEHGRTQFESFSRLEVCDKFKLKFFSNTVHNYALHVLESTKH